MILVSKSINLLVVTVPHSFPSNVQKLLSSSHILATPHTILGPCLDLPGANLALGFRDSGAFSWSPVIEQCWHTKQWENRMHVLLALRHWVFSKQRALWRLDDSFFIHFQAPLSRILQHPKSGNTSRMIVKLPGSTLLTLSLYLGKPEKLWEKFLTSNLHSHQLHHLYPHGHPVELLQPTLLGYAYVFPALSATWGFLAIRFCEIPGCGQ